MGVVSFARRSGAGFPELPVGFASARSWLRSAVHRALDDQARHQATAAAADRWYLVDAMARVSRDVSIGRRQTQQRRSDVARVDRDGLPLRNATAADMDKLVYAPASAGVSVDVGWHDVLLRADHSTLDLRPAPAEVDRVLGNRVPASPDCIDRELRVLQPADDCAVSVDPR